MHKKSREAYLKIRFGENTWWLNQILPKWCSWWRLKDSPDTRGLLQPWFHPLQVEICTEVRDIPANICTYIDKFIFISVAKEFLQNLSQSVCPLLIKRNQTGFWGSKEIRRLYCIRGFVIEKKNKDFKEYLKEETQWGEWCLKIIIPNHASN